MSLSVRIRLGSYDFAHPGAKQTQVYVQIPEVTRVSYLLPGDMYHRLRDRAWPEVVDIAQEHYERQWGVSDRDSAAARQRLQDWLRADANRDELQAAFEEEQVRRDPVARKLLEELLAALARVAELEKANAGLDDLRHRAFDKNEHLRAELDRAENDVTGACLARFEEEQESGRLRLAWGSARMRARRKAVALGKLRARVSERTRELVEMEADRNRWKARVDAARAVHVKHIDSEHCEHDGESWPCPTLAALGMCCHLHKPSGCCDPGDCGPCCEACPTCPTLARQRAEAGEVR